MKSSSLIKKQTERKQNDKLVQTILIAKKNKKWFRIAEILSSPRRQRASINLSKINDESKLGETIVVPGKVLSDGDIEKKIKIAALNFSEQAKEKLKKAGCEYLSILEEIKKNPDAKEIKILK